VNTLCADTKSPVFKQPLRGVTLIELLIATALTLLVMGAVATLFGQVGEAVNGTRSTLRVSEQLRHVQRLLESDLNGATALGEVNLSPADEKGYFEYVEGIDKDLVNTSRPSMLGDRDDALMFTSRKAQGQFSGAFGTPPPSGGGGGGGGPQPECLGDSPNVQDLRPSGWGESNQGYQTKHSWSETTNSNSATWNFSGLTPGVYEVSATWVPFSNRTTSALYTIIGDSTVEATVSQVAAPTGNHVAGGVNFQVLGTVQVSGSSLSVTLSGPVPQSGKYIVADAVRVECVDNLPSTPPPPPATVVSSGVKSNVAEVLWYTKIPDDSTNGLANLYRRQLVVASGANLSGESPSTFFENNEISARQTSSGMVGNSLGDLTRRMNRHARSSGFPFAFDASRVEALAGGREEEFIVLENVLSFDVRAWDPGAPILATAPAPPPPPSSGPECLGESPVVQDLRPSGWGESNQGYLSKHSWSETTNSSSATWNFSGLTPGVYEVSATWVPYSNRTTSALYTIVGDSTVERTVSQAAAPSGDHVAGTVNFQVLGTVQVSGSSLSVTLSGSVPQSGKYIVADAVRVECVDNLPSPPPPPPPPGSMNVGPADVAYTTLLGGGASITGYGAFVDLGEYAPNYTPADGAPSPRFNRGSSVGSQLTLPTYCTWSDHYNNSAHDGFDDPNNGIVGIIDDPGERQYMPPYESELQGIEIVIRVLEPASRRVKQVTIRQDYSR